MPRASRPKKMLRLPNFLSDLRRNWSTLSAPRQSVLVGAFAILLYAFEVDPERTPPTLGGPNEIIWRLLDSCLFPAETVPMQFKVWSGGEEIPNRPFDGQNSSGLRVQAEVVTRPIPFEKLVHLHSEPDGKEFNQQYNVAAGPYLVLDLISSSVSNSTDAHATLAILLHVLFFLANANHDLGIPTLEGTRGQALLGRLTVPKVGAIVAHDEWKRWKPATERFVRNSQYRESLASSAAARYNGPQDVSDHRWFTLVKEERKVWSSQDFQAWIQISLDEFSSLLKVNEILSFVDWSSES
ncbi:hypothetical protein JCM5350_006640 [Sporobolomyces pararoseus]